MKPQVPYTQTIVMRLLPLLESIAREFQERGEALQALEARIRRLVDGESDQLVAEAAEHKRELRHARKELELLGCSVIGEEPLTFRIPGRVGRDRKSFLWQSGAPAVS